jgi:hypothetical protein
MRYLVTALPIMMICLVVQSVVVAVCLRRYARFRQGTRGRGSLWMDIWLLSAIMLLTLASNFCQMAIWAGLFLWLGEFQDYGSALYHSTVNFVTLGYGDIVMSKTWRMLGPMESANGILMFGVSTAVMTAAVFDVIKYNIAAAQAPDSP